MRSVASAIRTCETSRLLRQVSSSFGWGMPDRICPICTTRQKTTCSFAKKWQSVLVWASSFRLKSPLSDRMDRKSKTKWLWKWLQVFDSREISGAPGQTRTGDPLLRSPLSTLIRTCRSDRKARENQQLVMNGDKLLTPFSSPLSRGFAAICHNYYYISMTEKITGPIKIT